MTHNKKNLLFLILPVILVLIYSLTGNSIGIRLDFGEEALTVSTSDLDWELPYDQIRQLSLRELPEPGTMDSGIDKRNLRCGDWRNALYGSYAQCLDPRIGQCLEITLSDGGVFLLNYENEESTQELYQMFTELLESKGLDA